MRDEGAMLCSNIDLSDVNDAVAELSPEMRSVAELLMDGDSFHQIAKKLEMSWNRVRRIVRDMQKLFQQQGLGTPRMQRDKRSCNADRQSCCTASPRRVNGKESPHEG